MTRLKKIWIWLNTFKEFLLHSIPEDIQLDIDSHDNKSWESAQKFIKPFNENRDQFFKISAKIEIQIKKYFSIDLEEEREHSGEKNDSQIVNELEKTDSHDLTENFEKKHPYAFVLGSVVHNGLESLKDLYIKTLKVLHSQNAELFSQLVDNADFANKKHTPYLSMKENTFHNGSEKISSDLYADTNLGAKQIIPRISALLKYVGMQQSDMKIYLREDLYSGRDTAIPGQPGIAV